MKTVFLILAILAPKSPALALEIPWSKIEIEKPIRLTQDITVPSSLQNPLVIPKNTRFKLKEIFPLEQLGTVDFQTEFSPCPSKFEGQSDEVFLVNDRYGFSLSSHCTLDIFVEAKELNLPSVFE